MQTAIGRSGAAAGHSAVEGYLGASVVAPAVERVEMKENALEPRIRVEVLASLVNELRQQGEIRLAAGR